jgi:lipopolysaccharide export system permease protein
MKLLDRYVFTEFLTTLSVATLAILGIFFGTVEFRQVIDTMSKFGVPWNTLLLVDMLQLPTSLVFVLPAGVVCAATLVWMRQHQAGELMALQICGVSRRRILAPFIALGLLAGVFAFALADYIAPQARHRSQKLMLARINNSDRPFPGKREIILHNGAGDIMQMMVFSDIDGNSAQGFVAFDFTNPDLVSLIYSNTAEWKKGTWNLESGQLCQVLLKDGSKGLHYKFGTMRVGGIASVARMIDSAPKTLFDKTTSEIRSEIDAFRGQGKPVPPKLMIQFYRRYSQPMSCVLLLIAAAPLVLMRRVRSSSAISFVYIGVLVASFFVLQDIFIALGDHGRIAPILAAWLPSVLLCVAGLTATLFVGRAELVTLLRKPKALSSRPRRLPPRVLTRS